MVLWTPGCFAFDFHDSRFQWYQPHLPVQDPQLFGRPLCPAAPRTHLRLSHSSPHRRRSTQFVCHPIGFLFQPCVTSLLFKGADTEQWMEKVHRDCCNHIDRGAKNNFWPHSSSLRRHGRSVVFKTTEVCFYCRRLVWRETAMDHGKQSVTHVIMIRVVSAGNAQLRSRSA